MTPKPKPTFSWAAIDALHQPDDAVPATAFTVRVYAERYGITEGRAHAQLAALVRAGKLATGKRHDGSANRFKCFFWVP